MRRFYVLFLCAAVCLHGQLFSLSSEQHRRIAHAAKELYKEAHRSLSLKQAYDVALFIEDKLPRYIQNKQYYIFRAMSNLAVDIEYDPVTQYRFIHLQGQPHSLLGKGALKSATKSILYHRKALVLIARCQQKVDFGSELRVTKKLRDHSGIVQLIAATKHRENGVVLHSLFLPIYRAGSMHQVFQQERFAFTLQEKIVIAYQILQGIEAMHKKNLAHRDLRAPNYFLDVSYKSGKRTFSAVIADLAYAVDVRKAHGIMAQADYLYLSPEALFTSRLKGKDYFAGDLFAIGTFFYRLLYEKKPLWQHSKTSQVVLYGPSENHKYEVLTKAIQKAQQINNKKEVNGPKEAFERVIWRMLSIDPKKRGSATKLKRDVERIIDRFYKRT